MAICAVLQGLHTQRFLCQLVESGLEMQVQVLYLKVVTELI